MSSSNAENVTIAANQDAHRIAAEVAETVIVNIALGEGVSRKLTMSYPAESGNWNF